MQTLGYERSQSPGDGGGGGGGGGCVMTGGCVGGAVGSGVVGEAVGVGVEVVVVAPSTASSTTPAITRATTAPTRTSKASRIFTVADYTLGGVSAVSFVPRYWLWVKRGTPSTQ